MVVQWHFRSTRKEEEPCGEEEKRMGGKPEGWLTGEGWARRRRRESEKGLGAGQKRTGVCSVEDDGEDHGVANKSGARGRCCCPNGCSSCPAGRRRAC